MNKRVSRLAANIPLARGNLCPLSFVDVPERAYIGGVLAVYELNRIELLRDVLVWAYERSSARYSAVRQSLGQPDPFRLRYRALVAAVVAEVVRAPMDKRSATALARQTAMAQVPPEDQARFVEVVETELELAVCLDAAGGEQIRQTVDAHVGDDQCQHVAHREGDAVLFEIGVRGTP